MFTETDSIDKKTCDPLSDEKETSKVDSRLAVEADFAKAESFLASAKTKLVDEMPLEQFHKQHNSSRFVANSRLLILSVWLWFVFYRMVDFIDRLKQSSSVNVTDSPVSTLPL